jgi:hypothetical protein
MRGRGGRYYLAMIQLRRRIERGMRHRWLGPLFVLLLVLLLVMTAIHAIHDVDHIATGAGEVCLGIAVGFGVIVLTRSGRQAQAPAVLLALGRAPPLARTLFPQAPILRLTPVPLRL